MRINHLERGHIYHFIYKGYKHDPVPLVLILWAGDGVVHGINVNYLPKDIRENLVDMLAKMAMGFVDWRDAYNFYHSYLKHKAPRMIRLSYRTYKDSLIKGITYVSVGAKSSIPKAPSKAEAKTKIIQSINHDLTIVKDNKTLSPAMAEEYAKMYVQAAKRITDKRGENLRPYTKLHRQRKK